MLVVGCGLWSKGCGGIQRCRIEPRDHRVQIPQHHVGASRSVGIPRAMPPKMCDAAPPVRVEAGQLSVFQAHDVATGGVGCGRYRAGVKACRGEGPHPGSRRGVLSNVIEDLKLPRARCDVWHCGQSIYCGVALLLSLAVTCLLDNQAIPSGRVFV